MDFPKVVMELVRIRVVVNNPVGAIWEEISVMEIVKSEKESPVRSSITRVKYSVEGVKK
jgi:hypothetical protein